ncbi:uncharacterized protein [Misgurnus anguillicaudatus]|uniref:uncharacterized protein isoform X2 n=1 Tax=Misgurnus anguillicaudatus TaxID=75329 RepID=UPI003CCF9906
MDVMCSKSVETDEGLQDDESIDQTSTESLDFVCNGGEQQQILQTKLKMCSVKLIDCRALMMKIKTEPTEIRTEHTEIKTEPTEIKTEPTEMKTEPTEEEDPTDKDDSCDDFDDDDHDFIPSGHYGETISKNPRAEADSEEERMRKLHLEELVALVDADTGSNTEEVETNNNILICHQESVTQWNNQDEGRVMRADVSNEEDGEEYDVRDATYVPEDEGDNDEDDDVNSSNIVFQEQSGASEQSKIPQMGKPCGPKCKKKCTTKITEDQRRQLFRAYWNMSYSEKKSFIFHMVSQCQTMRHTTAVPSRRTRTLRYYLNDDLGQQQEVCKTTFLTTLGYHPKNDRLIVTVFGNTVSSSLAPPQERRGRHTPINKIDMASIFEHIESFNPTSSHYRPEHAPHRRYLPSDVSIQSMFQDYKENNAFKCSYETYRKAVKERNISFTKLGEEECESCLRQDVHIKAEHQNETAIQECHSCQKWEEHKRRAESGRHQVGCRKGRV